VDLSPSAKPGPLGQVRVIWLCQCGNKVSGFRCQCSGVSRISVQVSVRIIDFDAAVCCWNCPHLIFQRLLKTNPFLTPDTRHLIGASLTGLGCCKAPYGGSLKAGSYGPGSLRISALRGLYHQGGRLAAHAVGHGKEMPFPVGLMLARNVQFAEFLVGPFEVQGGRCQSLFQSHDA